MTSFVHLSSSNRFAVNRFSTPNDAFESFVAGESKEVAIKELVVGDGEDAGKGKILRVEYKGRLMSNGEQFQADSFSFKSGGGSVMPGFDKGIEGMKVGGKRVLRIPASLGYGARGSGKLIPPNSDLEFDVELTDVAEGPIAEFMVNNGLGNNRKTYGLVGLLAFLAISPMFS